MVSSPSTRPQEDAEQAQQDAKHVHAVRLVQTAHDTRQKQLQIRAAQECAEAAILLEK